MLIIRGASALSDFRIQKLLNTLTPKVSGLQAISAQFVHFAEVSKALSDQEQQRMLTTAHNLASSKEGLMIVSQKSNLLTKSR